MYGAGITLPALVEHAPGVRARHGDQGLGGGRMRKWGKKLGGALVKTGRQEWQGKAAAKGRGMACHHAFRSVTLQGDRRASWRSVTDRVRNPLSLAGEAGEHSGRACAAWAGAMRGF